MDISGDRRNERIYYDGKNFTVFGERVELLRDVRRRRERWPS